MANERRKHPRIARPLDGTWQGNSASGLVTCRIGDLSLGGCFIYSRAVPVRGEEAVVTTKLDDLEITLTGHIVNIDPGMGFSVQFRDLSGEQVQELEAFLAVLQK